MAELGLALAFHLRDNALGQDLAKFDAPLIERVDVPHRSLGEDAVLVQSDELSERRRGEAIQQDRVGRPIAFAYPVPDEPIRRPYGLDLFARLAEGERLGLRKYVRQQHVMMAAEPVERVGERDEVARHEPGALVDQLVERVLTVGTRFAPVDRTGLMVDRGSGKRYVLAVALHRQLLKIGRESLQILVVRQHRD